METEIDPVLDRIQQRLKATGKSERGAAEEAGLSAAAIRNLREGKSQSPRLETIRKLAPVLDSTPEWLAFGIEGLGAFGERGLEVRPTIEPDADEGATSIGTVAPRGRALIPARYAGRVEAGSFRPTEDFDPDPDRDVLWEPQDRDFPDMPLFFVDVEGDSMNALKPRAILPGDQVIVIEFEGLRGRVALRDGMVVVVEQTLDGGHHSERSVKQIELYEDRIEFCPRSTNPKHKPIVVPRTVFADPSEEDGRQVRILSLVRRISNEVPLS
jgi:transcriptional regulator with XRE-family HTH domain